MAFTAAPDSDLSIAEAKDIAGLTVAVGSGTNQERILLDWNEKNQAAGLEPATLDYYANAADALLAITSGRVDAYLGPEPERGVPGEQGRGLGRRHGQRRVAEHHLRRGHHAQGQRPGRRACRPGCSMPSTTAATPTRSPAGGCRTSPSRAGGEPAGGVLTR